MMMEISWLVWDSKGERGLKWHRRGLRRPGAGHLMATRSSFMAAPVGKCYPNPCHILTTLGK